jgi:hypothetical protein
MTESIDNGCFDTEKLIMEMGNMFCDTHKTPHKFYEAVFG